MLSWLWIIKYEALVLDLCWVQLFGIHHLHVKPTWLQFDVITWVCITPHLKLAAVSSGLIIETERIGLIKLRPFLQCWPLRAYSNVNWKKKKKNYKPYWQRREVSQGRRGSPDKRGSVVCSSQFSTKGGKTEASTTAARILSSVFKSSGFHHPCWPSDHHQDYHWCAQHSNILVPPPLQAYLSKRGGGRPVFQV